MWIQNLKGQSPRRRRKRKLLTMGRLLASNARGDRATALRRNVNIITFAHACKEMKWQGASKKLAAGTKDF